MWMWWSSWAGWQGLLLNDNPIKEIKKMKFERPGGVEPRRVDFLSKPKYHVLLVYESTPFAARPTAFESPWVHKDDGLFSTVPARPTSEHDQSASKNLFFPFLPFLYTLSPRLESSWNRLLSPEKSVLCLARVYHKLILDALLGSVSCR